METAMLSVFFIHTREDALNNQQQTVMEDQLWCERSLVHR